MLWELLVVVLFIRFALLKSKIRFFHRQVSYINILNYIRANFFTQAGITASNHLLANTVTGINCSGVQYQETYTQNQVVNVRVKIFTGDSTVTITGEFATGSNPIAHFYTIRVT